MVKFQENVWVTELCEKAKEFQRPLQTLFWAWLALLALIMETLVLFECHEYDQKLNLRMLGQA